MNGCIWTCFTTKFIQFHNYFDNSLIVVETVIIYQFNKNCDIVSISQMKLIYQFNKKCDIVSISQMKLIYPFKNVDLLPYQTIANFRNSNNTNLFVKTRMDENIVYFMLDIMITNISIPTSREIREPFHAKKEQ